MAKDRVGVADPWTHWEAVDGIVNCQDIEGRFADARNFEKDSSTILFWVHAAWCNSCCCLHREQAQRLRKENWSGFPFRAHSSQVRSNPFLCRVHPLIDIWSTCIYLNCACASQSQGRSSWSPSNLFNWVRWSFCDGVLYRLIYYCDKVWLICLLYLRNVCDGLTDWCEHGTLAALCRKDSQDERRGVVFLDEAQRSIGWVMQWRRVLVSISEQVGLAERSPNLPLKAGGFLVEKLANYINIII